MSTGSLKRKLTAILYTDVAGYSRLTGDDEEGTHRRVMEVLDFASAQIGNGDGSVLRYAGDAILAEFSSTVAAVKCAMSIQLELNVQNQSLSDDRKVQIRIGINIGDVIEDRGEVFGDGVNLAARLEAAAAEGKSVGDIFADAAKAASDGAEATKDMQAKFGRARNLGERTIGHKDPGATSMSLIFQSFAESI